MFDVNEEIPLTGRGTNPRLLYGEEELPLEIPSAIRLDRVGVYRILQDLESGKKARSVVFIKVPASESDFDAETANTDGLFDLDRPERADRAIYWYAAILLLCLLALERFLHSLKTM